MPEEEVKKQENTQSPVPQAASNTTPSGDVQGEQKPIHKKAITATLVAVVVIVVLATVFIAVSTLRTDQTGPTPPAPIKQEADINDEKDLQKLEDELNSLDVSDVEKGLEENDADASKF